MLGKIRSVTLLVCVAVILCCTLGFKALYRLGVPLPDFLGTAEETNYLEARQYAKVPTFSLDTFADGSFQDDLETYIGDALPVRDALLNASKASQRLAISQSASLFGFDIYPTFFGSSYLYYPAGDRVFEAPKKTTDEYASNVSKTAAAISAFADQHSELSVYFAMPYRSGVLDMGPVSNLVSNQVGRGFFEEMLYKKFASSVTVIDLTPASYEEFDVGFYRTDLHWDIEGAYPAYVVINATMGNADSTVKNGELVHYEQAAWFGSSARSGLDLDTAPDVVEDYVFDLPELSVEQGGTTYGYDFLASAEAYSDGFVNTKPCRELYANYFHSNFGEFTITNQSATSGKNLLLVGDSFTNCVERLFAASYDTVYVLDPRYAEDSAEEFVAQHPDIDDVLFLETYNTLQRGKL